MDTAEDKPYIFLDPDGTKGMGLSVIVMAPTGVIYAHQCGGLSVLERAIEGFAVPLGGVEAAEQLIASFRARFHGNPPDMDTGSTASAFDGWSTGTSPENTRKLAPDFTDIVG